jgi:hypothetical protein
LFGLLLQIKEKKCDRNSVNSNVKMMAYFIDNLKEKSVSSTPVEKGIIT